MITSDAEFDLSFVNSSMLRKHCSATILFGYCPAENSIAYNILQADSLMSPKKMLTIILTFVTKRLVLYNTIKNII